MHFFSSSHLRLRVLFLFVGLLVSLLVVAQVTLKYRMLNGYALNDDAPLTKGKPTMFILDQADAFEKVFKPAQTGGKRPNAPNFSRETAIGIVLPPSTKPPRVSISRVFVQDSVLNVRYIRIKDTTSNKTPLATPVQPTLLLAIPTQKVLKTRLIENGKVIVTLRTKEEK